VQEAGQISDCSFYQPVSTSRDDPVPVHVRACGYDNNYLPIHMYVEQNNKLERGL